MDFLSGYRTYISASLLAVVTFLKVGGFIEPATADALQGLLVALTAIFLRAAVK